MRKLVMAVMAFLFVVGTQSAFAKNCADRSSVDDCNSDENCAYIGSCVKKCQKRKKSECITRNPICELVGNSCKPACAKLRRESECDTKSHCQWNGSSCASKPAS